MKDFEYTRDDLARLANSVSLALYLFDHPSDIVKDELSKGRILCDLLDRGLDDSDHWIPKDLDLQFYIQGLARRSPELSARLEQRDRARMSITLAEHGEEIPASELEFLQEYFTSLASTFTHQDAVNYLTRKDREGCF